MTEITYKERNILQTKPSDKPIAICHITNIFGQFGSAGALAFQIAMRWPIMLEAYKECLDVYPEDKRAGIVNYAEVEKNIYVFNLLAHTKIPTSNFESNQNERECLISYSALSECLEKVYRIMCEETSGTDWELHIPKLGTGTCGGDWTKISEIIRKIFCEHDIPVIVYEFKPKVILNCESATNSMDIVEAFCEARIAAPMTPYVDEVLIEYLNSPSEEILAKEMPVEVAHTIDVIFKESVRTYEEDVELELDGSMKTEMFETPYELFDSDKIFFGLTDNWRFPITIYGKEHQSTQMTNWEMHNFYYKDRYEFIEDGKITNFYQDIDIFGTVDNWKEDLLKALYRVVKAVYDDWKERIELE